MRLRVIWTLLLASLLVVGTPPPASAQDALKEAQRELEKAQKESRKRRNAARSERRRNGRRGAWGISDSGALLAAGTPLGSVELFDARTGERTRVPKGRHVGILAHDAGAWYDADKKGKLITVELLPEPEPEPEQPLDDE